MSSGLGERNVNLVERRRLSIPNSRTATSDLGQGEGGFSCLTYKIGRKMERSVGRRALQDQLAQSRHPRKATGQMSEE